MAEPLTIEHYDREASPRWSWLDLLPLDEGLTLGVSADGGSASITLTDEEAAELERALYLHRITKPFDGRQKEDNA